MRRAAKLPMEALAPFLFEDGSSNAHGAMDDADKGQALDWPRLFGNNNPVEIEVGFGKGLFLVTSAQLHPDTNFLGVEIERKYVLFTATRVAKRALHNVKLACTDARAFLRACVRAGSVSALHVFFPDPWWKNRHRKRKLFTQEFAAECARTLVAGGVLHFVSDVREYFEETAGTLGNVKSLTALPPPEVSDPKHPMDFLTNFERKYRLAGRPIYRGLWKKKPPEH